MWNDYNNNNNNNNQDLFMVLSSWHVSKFTDYRDNEWVVWKKGIQIRIDPVRIPLSIQILIRFGIRVTSKI